MSAMQDLKKDCILAAKELGNYQALSVTELMDGYCKADDEHDESKKNSYFGAIILRFWYMINKLYVKHHVALRLDHEDFYSWLADAIIMTCAPEHRAWQKKEGINAQTCLQQTIGTRFEAAAYYSANLQCHKDYYTSESLDAELDEQGTTIGDLVPADEVTFGDSAKDLVQIFVDQDKITEAAILDIIANNDVFKHEKSQVKVQNGDELYKYTKYTDEFWPYQLVRVINALPAQYKVHFAKKYNIDNGLAAIAVDNLQALPNCKKYKYISNTLATAKKVLAF